jgi:hypothetical protein
MSAPSRNDLSGAPLTGPIRTTILPNPEGPNWLEKPLGPPARKDCISITALPAEAHRLAEEFCGGPITRNPNEGVFLFYDPVDPRAQPLLAELKRIHVCGHLLKVTIEGPQRSASWEPCGWCGTVAPAGYREDKRLQAEGKG